MDQDLEIQRRILYLEDIQNNILMLLERLAKNLDILTSAVCAIDIRIKFLESGR